jgi:cell division protein FtsB
MQIKSKYKDTALDFVRRLNDVRFVGQMIFVAVVLMISWSGVKSIQTNYNLQKQITALNNQNTLKKLENENLSLKNEYFKSKQYLELAARQNFALAAPGEKLVIVPTDVALAHTVDLPDPAKEQAAKTKQSAYERNLRSWVDFFLHRQGN